MATKRLAVDLPKGFDPEKHGAALVKKLNEQYGGSWTIDSLDLAKREAFATSQTEHNEVIESVSRKQTKEISLGRNVKPSDGDRLATKYEDQYPGFVLTSFEPYLGTAVMTKLEPATRRARGAIANVLGVKPWEVQISDRAGGGFDLVLPQSKYASSKHDDKLQVATETDIGREGWYIKTNPQKLTASIIPADPPTFPGAIPYPFSGKGLDKNRARLPLGQQLGQGSTPGAIQYLDLDAAPHTQVSGTSGGGKSVVLNAIIAGALARGMELAIVDLPAKSVDFIWCKSFVRPGGWGCDSLEGAVATMSMIYEEGQRRAKLLAEHGVTKMADLPAAICPREILAVVDEVTGLFYPEKVPKGLPKDHELVIEPQEINMLKAVLESRIAKAAAELRFVGIKLVLSSQVSSTTTGVSTAIRLNLANKMLLGTNPTDNNRKLSLSDHLAVPKVPTNVREDDKANRGVGVTEFEGQKPAVFKGYYASTQEYQSWLTQLNVPRTNRPAPTPTEIARHTPALSSDTSSSKEGFGHGPRHYEEWEIDPKTGEPWKDGFQKANAARAALAK